MLNRLTFTSWKQAFGELALIVVGVSIAIAATSWYEEFQDRIYEQEILIELQSSLVDISTLMVTRSSSLEVQQSSISDLLEKLNTADSYNGGALPGLGALANFLPTNQDMAVYEVLKSKGFTVIRNAELRNNIVKFYELEFPAVSEIWKMEQTYLMNHIHPWLNSYAIALQSGGFALADIESARNSTELRNMSITKLRRLEFNFRLHRGLLLSINKILKGIEDELGEV